MFISDFIVSNKAEFCVILSDNLQPAENRINSPFTSNDTSLLLILLSLSDNTTSSDKICVNQCNGRVAFTARDHFLALQSQDDLHLKEIVYEAADMKIESTNHCR